MIHIISHNDVAAAGSLTMSEICLFLVKSQLHKAKTSILSLVQILFRTLYNAFSF